VLRRLTACFLVSIEERTIVLVTGAGFVPTRPKHSWDDVAMQVSPPLDASIAIPAIVPLLFLTTELLRRRRQAKYG
jgi:hypothetical protein